MHTSQAVSTDNDQFGRWCRWWVASIGCTVAKLQAAPPRHATQCDTGCKLHTQCHCCTIVLVLTSTQNFLVEIHTILVAYCSISVGVSLLWMSHYHLKDWILYRKLAEQAITCAISLVFSAVKILFFCVSATIPYHAMVALTHKNSMLTDSTKHKTDGTKPSVAAQGRRFGRAKGGVEVSWQNVCQHPPRAMNILQQSAVKCISTWFQAFNTLQERDMVHTWMPFDQGHQTSPGMSSTYSRSWTLLEAQACSVQVSNNALIAGSIESVHCTS